MLANRRNKDQAMAAAMKAAGVERTAGRCPVCYRMAANGSHPTVNACRLPLPIPGRRSRAVKLELAA